MDKWIEGKYKFPHIYLKSLSVSAKKNIIKRTLHLTIGVTLIKVRWFVLFEKCYN